jgi:hypothetical protein
MDSVREQLIKWHQTTRVTRTHPDTRVHRKDPSGHLPSRAHSRHPQGTLPKKRTKKGQGQRRTQKDENKAWSAEAILEESDSQYLVKYEPVEEGAQFEISWHPKHYANAALIAWWEERKTEITRENSNAERDNVAELSSEDNDASQRYTRVENHGRPQKSVTGLLPQEQHDGKSEDIKQHTVSLVDKSASQSNEEPDENTLLKASTANVPEASNVPVPEINVTVANVRPSQAWGTSRLPAFGVERSGKSI